MSDPVRILRVIARLDIGGPALHVSYLTFELDRIGHETTRRRFGLSSRCVASSASGHTPPRQCEDANEIVDSLDPRSYNRTSRWHARRLGVADGCHGEPRDAEALAEQFERLDRLSRDPNLR